MTWMKLAETRNFTIPNGTTVDLTALAGNYTTDMGWHNPEDVKELTVGQVAFVFSYGDWRRGVVTKIGRTKATVTFVTRTGVENARAGTGWGVGAQLKVTAKSEGVGGLLVSSSPVMTVPSISQGAAPAPVEAVSARGLSTTPDPETGRIPALEGALVVEADPRDRYFTHGCGADVVARDRKLIPSVPTQPAAPAEEGLERAYRDARNTGDLEEASRLEEELDRRGRELGLAAGHGTPDPALVAEVQELVRDGQTVELARALVAEVLDPAPARCGAQYVRPGREVACSRAPHTDKDHRGSDGNAVVAWDSRSPFHVPAGYMDLGVTSGGTPVLVAPFGTPAPGPEDLADLALAYASQELAEHPDPEETVAPAVPRCAVGDVVTIHRGDRLYEVLQADFPLLQARVAPCDPEDHRDPQWVSQDLLHVRAPLGRYRTEEITERVRQTREVFSLADGRAAPGRGGPGGGRAVPPGGGPGRGRGPDPGARALAGPHRIGRLKSDAGTSCHPDWSRLD